MKRTPDQRVADLLTQALDLINASTDTRSPLASLGRLISGGWVVNAYQGADRRWHASLVAPGGWRPQGQSGALLNPRTGIYWWDIWPLDGDEDSEQSVTVAALMKLIEIHRRPRDTP